MTNELNYHVLLLLQMGTHSELIKKKNVYYKLVNEQEKENSDKSEDWSFIDVIRGKTRS